MTEQKHVFSSEKTVCDASLHLPAVDNPPVVVMAHGFAAERQFGTGSTIAAFCNAGYAVFSFDYRGFGNSQGKPRQLVDPGKHCEDWYNAIQYVRSLNDIDANRMVLWGSSFSGGHVIATAARFHRLRGVIAQVPFCTSRAMNGTIPLGSRLTAMGHVLWDLVLAPFGAVHEIPVVGDPEGPLAAMQYPGWKEDYLKLAEGSATWRNAIPARSMLGLANYHPADSARSIECPVLVMNGREDQAVTRESVLEMVDKLTEVTHLEWDFDHFDLYEGFPLHREAVDAQLEFLSRVFAD